MIDVVLEPPDLTDLPWAVVEVLGHRTYVGQVEEVEVAGLKMLRVHVPERVTTVEEPHYGFSPPRARTVTTTHYAFVVDVAARSLHTVERLIGETTARGVLHLSAAGSEPPMETVGDWHEPPPKPKPDDSDDIPFSQAHA